ncbi:MAG: tRNA (N(6)-L-threonylcarbamoyladenosine(37)-C(2))-methylthiotransferase MtaB [Flavobacteriales bacterium]|nr:tRNA (N(6)-L-threonylcarbamoyladenosine(37)-C(2))-methylthiotransferase MtaB [Flavobacteriales bacterium]
MQRTVAFHTLGCKLNFAETSTIGRQLRHAGFEHVDFNERADIYVINTCSVTDRADATCRNIVRNALRSNPDGFVAVIGCYAQLKPEEIATIPGVDIVLGANEKFNLPSYLNDLSKRPKAGVHSCEVMQVREFVPSYSAGDRTRTFLKVQDGCDYFCAFCTIPLARGRSRSENITKTLEAAGKATATGVKEIVLTGVNIGDFGAGTDSTFLDLIRQLDSMEGDVERFRISSIEPNLLSNSIIDFCASSQRFVPHFHIPLQSGSDRILKAMRRRYDSALYADRIAHIKQVMPDACIGVDVIVGFPGETQEEFEATYQFLNELSVSYLHVFTYSERPDTTALRIKENVVPMDERKRRNRMLTILSEKKKRAFYGSFAGTERPVLFEQEDRDGQMFGFTDNYLRVTAPFDPEMANRIVPVRLEKLNNDGHFIATLPVATATNC